MGAFPLNAGILLRVSIVVLALTFGLLFLIDQAFAQTDSLWTSSVVPTHNQSNNQSTEFGVRFFSDVAGDVYSIRFYKEKPSTAAHYVYLWGPSGNLLVQQLSTNETVSGWQTVNLDTPVAIVAGQVYTAGYHNSENYAVDHHYFTKEHSNGVLHAPVNAGVYTTAANNYYNPVLPTTVYEASNYWIDVIFVPSQTPPPPPPPPPPPVNGQCGPANGTPTPNAPTSGLCSAGTPSPVSGAGPWTWMCTGSDGGTTASCAAPVLTNTTFTWDSEYDVNSTITVNGNPYVPELDTSKTWPPMEFATNVASNGALGDLWQFEIHSGDVSNIGSERVELDGYKHTIPLNTEFWVSYAVKVLPGQVIPNLAPTNGWNIMGQVHRGAPTGNPDISSKYYNDQFYFDVGNNSAPGANIDHNGNGTVYISPVLPRNVWHNVVYDAIKSSSGTSDKLIIWFDGVQVYNQTGNIMQDHASGSYFKYGWYRAAADSSHPLPVAVNQFANVEVSTSTLLSRVTNPLPTPTPQ